jgi:hypothetical protein
MGVNTNRMINTNIAIPKVLLSRYRVLVDSACLVIH